MRYEHADGSALSQDDLYLTMRHRPNLHYRAIAEEYNVAVSHTDKGYRGTEDVTDPEVLFLGDSFTFGQGLSNEDTFPARLCADMSWRCVNLGYSGSGTTFQLDLLESYLETYGWRPKEVRLHILAMSDSLVSGNDFADNLYYELIAEGRKRHGPDFMKGENPKDRLQIMKSYLMEYSNLARIAFLVVGDLARQYLAPEMAEKDKQHAMKLMRQALDRFSEMSTVYGFSCRIYVLSPLAELASGAHQKTYRTIAAMVSGNCSMGEINTPSTARGRARAIFLSA